MKRISEPYIKVLSKHRKKILLVFVIWIVAMAISLFNVTLDLSTESFLFKDDPRLKAYRTYQDTFGNESGLILAIKGDVYSNEYLNTIYAFQQDIDENMPYIDDSTSIINTSQIYTEVSLEGDETLYVSDLLEDFPDTQLTDAELENLRSVINNDPLMRDRTVSADGAYSTIFVSFKSASQIREEERLAAAGGTDTSQDTEDLFDDLDSFFDDETSTENTDESSALTDSSVESEPPVYFLSNQENIYIKQTIDEISKKYDSEDFTISKVGEPLMIPNLITYLLSDVVTFFPILVVMMIVFIRLLFRRASAIAFCLAVAGITNVITMGTMVALGIPITLVTNIVPLILFTMSVGAVIHLLVLVYQNYDSGLSKEQSLSKALAHSGTPIILTSLTSAAGVFSFYFSSLQPVRQFGIFGAFGLLISLILTLVFVPILFMNLKLKRKERKKVENTNLTKVDALLVRVSKYSYRYRIVTFIVAALIIVVSIVGVQRVFFSHRPISWIPPHSTFRQDTITIDKVFKGSNTMIVYIDTKEDGLALSSEFLQTIDTYKSKVMAYDDGHVKVGNVTSFADIVKKTNQALADTADYDQSYVIPDSTPLIAQEVLLLENGGADLSSMTDLNYRYFSILLMLPELDAVYFTKFITYNDALLAELFEGKDYEIFSTGSIGLLSRVITATMESARTSYIIAFIVITFLMTLLTRHIVIGLVSMIPNLLPLFFLLALIGYTPINLDMFVMLLGSVLLGLAVDNTIHFIHVFRDLKKEGQSDQDAITHTFLSTGKAMLTASIILIFGFSVFLFARMLNFRNFGIMATVGVCVALFSDFFLTPALMTLFKHKKKKE